MNKTFVVAGQAGQVRSISVRLDVQHPNLADLDIVLVSPSGARFELMTDLGGSDADLISTELSTAATTPVGQGEAPFTGSFRPEGDLSA